MDAPRVEVGLRWRRGRATRRDDSTQGPDSHSHKSRSTAAVHPTWRLDVCFEQSTYHLRASDQGILTCRRGGSGRLRVANFSVLNCALQFVGATSLITSRSSYRGEHVQELLLLLLSALEDSLSDVEVFHLACTRYVSRITLGVQCNRLIRPNLFPHGKGVSNLCLLMGCASNETSIELPRDLFTRSVRFIATLGIISGSFSLDSSYPPNSLNSSSTLWI